MSLDQLTSKTLAMLNNVGIKLNPEGHLNNRDIQQLKEWAEEYPDYPIEWLEKHRQYIIDNNVMNFATVMKQLEASAKRNVPVGWKGDDQPARADEIDDQMLERHFARVEENKQIEGTQDWKLAQRMAAKSDPVEV